MAATAQPADAYFENFGLWVAFVRDRAVLALQASAQYLPLETMWYKIVDSTVKGMPAAALLTEKYSVTIHMINGTLEVNIEDATGEITYKKNADLESLIVTVQLTVSSLGNHRLL